MENFKKFFTEKLAEKILANTASDETKEIIRSLYKKIFRKDMNESCNSCFVDAFFELYNLYKSDLNKFNELFECEYELNYGVVLSEFSNTETICTRTNVTNKLAEHYLRLNPSNAALFSVMPSDWEERIKETETEAGETGTGETGTGETGTGETEAGETGTGETGTGETEAGETGTGETGTEATILPEGFPARQKLIDSGFDSIEKLKACENLLSIPGIGEVSVKQISDELANL